MDKILGNFDINELYKYYNENREMIDMLNRNMSQNDLFSQIQTLQNMNIPPNLRQSETLYNNKFTELLNNSVLEMHDPEKEHKKLVLEYKRNPKTNYEILLSHHAAVNNIRNNKQNAIYAFINESTNPELSLFSRTSNLSKKMTKSNCNINGMQKILIRDLEIEQTNKSKYVILKVIDLPVKVTALQMLLEDEVGDIAMFSIYNYERVKKIRNFQELDEEFKGKYVLIHEPYYKVFKNKFAGIRVDNPEEIQIFENLEEFKIFFENSENQTSEQLKNMGNQFMIKNEYHKAKSFYEKALEKDTLNAILYSNLAEVNLRLNYNLLSLKYSNRALEILEENQNNPIFEKIILRKSKALYNLNRFLECKMELANIKLNTSEKIKVVEEIQKLCDLKIQNQNGIFDFKKMLFDENDKFYIDMADFKSTKIDKNFSNERGVFISANTSIPKGELICCSKSIACQKYSQDPYLKTKPSFQKEEKTNNTKISFDSEENRKILIEKVIGREEEYEEFFCLYDGENSNQNLQERKNSIKNFNKFAEKDTNYIVKKINNILKLNSFGCGRGLLNPKKTATGLWVFPSFFNHSCVSNTLIYGIGDFLILKAGKDIEKNEELTVSYVTFESCYESRKHILENWKFACKCALCSYQITYTINNPIKKYAFDVIEVIKEKLFSDNDDLDKLALNQIAKQSSNFICNELMSYNRKFSLAISDNKKKEIINKLRNDPKEFYDYLNINKKLFSKIEMSLILFIYITNISQIVDEKFLIELSTKSYELIKDNLLWFEIKMLLYILSIYMSIGDTNNYDKIFKIIYDKYSYLTNYDMDLFMKIFN